MLLFGQAPIATPIDPYIQYGSFGLMAFLVWWMLARAFPKLTGIFQDSLNKMLVTFEREQAECREERMAAEARMAAERKEDREARHTLANQLHDSVSELAETHRQAIDTLVHQGRK